MNRHSGFLAPYQSFALYSKTPLIKNASMILPHYDSLIYNNIIDLEYMDLELIYFLAEEMNKHYSFIEDNETVKDKLARTFKEIGLVNVLSIGKAIHDVSYVVNPSYNEKIENLINKAQCTTDNPTGLPYIEKIVRDSIKAQKDGDKPEVPWTQEIGDSFKDNYVSGVVKEGMNILAEHTSKFEQRIREFDHLLMQYAKSKNKKERQLLKTQILKMRSEFLQTIPSFVRTKTDHLLTKTMTKQIKNNPKNAVASKAYLNIRTALKRADKIKGPSREYHSLLKDYKTQLQSEQMAGYFKRNYGKKVSEATLKKLQNPKSQEGLVLRNAEYKKYLGHMANAKSIVSNGLRIVDIFVSTYTVYEAYRNDQNWIKVAFRETGSLLASEFGGKLSLPLITTLTSKIPGLHGKILYLISNVAVAILAGYAGGIGAEAIYDQISDEDKQFILENGFIYAPI